MLFKRKGYKCWYIRYKDEAGNWQQKSSGCLDKKAAEAVNRELEREITVPGYRGAGETSLEIAIEDHGREINNRGVAPGTVKVFLDKIKPLTRLLGEQTPIRKIDAEKVDRYISSRLSENVSRHTIGKELSTLRGILTTAQRLGKFHVDPRTVLPAFFRKDYVPRKTALTVEQFEALQVALKDRKPNQIAFVTFIVATGARYGEAMRAQRTDIDLEHGLVRLRITKTARKTGKIERFVPITYLTRPLLAQVLEATAERKQEDMFDRWINIRRDVLAACEKAKVPGVTCNDLRRTHSKWLVTRGVDYASVAAILGHVDSTMVERVYGQLSPEELRDRVLGKLGTLRVHVKDEKGRR